MTVNLNVLIFTRYLLNSGYSKKFPISIKDYLIVIIIIIIVIDN